MYEKIIPWVVLTLLFVLCLPIPAVGRLVLAITSWSLRLALFALLGGAAYLWFRPAELPAGVLDAAASFPRLLAALPDPTSPNFGVALAAIVVGAMLPVLAILDVFRQAARRLRDRDRLRSAEPAAEVAPRATPEAVARAPVGRPVGRAAAAEVIASAGARPAPAAAPQRR
jgi:hypothetical protein